MPSSLRPVLFFLATVFGGIAATVLAPLLPLQIAHAQSTPAHTARTHTGLTQTATPRATSAATQVWTRAIAVRPLLRGDTLRTDDFVLADTLVQRRPPYGVDTTTPQVGWLVQRPIGAGEWLRTPAVIPAPAVTAGRPVHAIYNDGTVQLAVSGIALRSAPLGGAVSVRVGRTRRLDGIVIAPDSVRLR
jgi:flagellar basal body P-ring formation protein FlgA